MRLAVLTNSLDARLAELLALLAQAGLSLACRQAGGTAAADPALALLDAEDFARAAREAEVLLCVVNPSEPGADCYRQLPAGGRPLILDISRASLKVRSAEEYALKRFILEERPRLLARHERQLRDFEGRRFAGEALVCEDLLYPTRLPGRVAADVAWFLRRAAGRTDLAQPPSRSVAALHGGALDDAALAATARATLEVFPEFSPALAYLAAPEARAAGRLPEALRQRLEKDPEGWLSVLSLARALPDDGAAAREIASLREHAFEAVPPKTPGRKRILLCVGRKQRDLFIVLILRYWLERHGHEVFVRPSLNMPRETLLELLPDAVVWGERTTQFKFELGRFARERNILSLVRREEAGHTYSSWRAADESRRTWWVGHNDYSDVVAREIFSGAECADLTASFGHLPQARTRWVGAMLFDVYFLQGFGQVLPPRGEFLARHGLSPEKPTMMFCARWAHADRERGNAIPEAIRRKGGSSADDPEVDRYIAMCREGRAKWLDALTRLYKDRGERWNFIMRPHPGERVDAYVEHFREQGMHIPVLLDDYMPVLLSYVDLVIHAASTSALEAHFLGKPAISFGDPKPDYLPISRLSPSCQEYRDLLRLVDGVRLGESNGDESVVRLIQREHYGPIDGQACRRAAAQIHEALALAKGRPFRKPADKVVPYAEGTNADAICGNARLEEMAQYYALVTASLDGMNRRDG